MKILERRWYLFYFDGNVYLLLGKNCYYKTKCVLLYIALESNYSIFISDSEIFFKYVIQSHSEEKKDKCCNKRLRCFGR